LRATSDVVRVDRHRRDHVHDLQCVAVQTVGDQAASDVRGRWTGVSRDAVKRVTRDERAVDREQAQQITALLGRRTRLRG